MDSKRYLSIRNATFFFRNQSEAALNKAILITTTSDDRDELETIAARLVDQRLAACCQISGPITSVYRWDEKIDQSEEWVCSIKTMANNFASVEKLITECHHYQTPEIVGLPVTQISQSYLDWMHSEINEC